MKHRFTFLLLLIASTAYTQTCGNFELRHSYDIPADCSGMTMTMKHDITGKPFLYVASKDAGLKIYNVASDPILVQTIPAARFHSLHVMNLSQRGELLYLALGNHFGFAAQSPGFAIVDVRTPAKANVVSLWYNDRLKGGAGIVESAGKYVFLGAMGNGLMIFDASDRLHITMLSSLIPDMHFPDPKPDSTKFNARGMAVRNNYIYLCYDAGGLRIINVADPRHPLEIGRYSNPVMNGKPRAYNNIVLDGALAYVTVDYCGLEILNISDPSAIALVRWWNPWTCQTSGFNWFKSDGHANEIALDTKKKLLFISTGKSDLHVLDVSHPTDPEHCAIYGGTANNIGTWGVSIYENNVYLSYICTLGIPFASRWTGVKILTHDDH